MKIKDTQGMLGNLLVQIPRGHLIAAGSLMISLMTALVLSPDKQAAVDVASDSTSVEIPSNFAREDSTYTTEAANFNVPDFGNLLQVANSKPEPEKAAAEPSWQNLTIKSGDNLSSIFAQAGLNDRDIYELFDGNKSAKDLRSIAPGQKIAFLLNNEGKLQELKYYKNKLDSLEFTRNANGFTTQAISLQPELKHTLRQGTINSSLFVSAKQAGLPTGLIMDMANIFGYDIDFALDIKKGDSFKVVFEERYLDGKKIGTGSILSAEFINDGKVYRAVRYTNKEGVTRYYAADGHGLNRAFLRTPVDFVRISDPFTLARRHPILNTIRAHKGVDYAAAKGTPIRATGDGKVTFAGREGGYGNLIVIQHGQGYETRYGHMNSFAKGISTGSRVTQGQIIGTVGMTGLATGPHLHYEFHVNGQVRDPVTVPLPQSVGIAANEKERFNNATQTLVAQLDDAGRNSRIAMGESKTKSN